MNTIRKIVLAVAIALSASACVRPPTGIGSPVSCGPTGSGPGYQGPCH